MSNLNPKSTVRIRRTLTDFDFTDFDHLIWNSAESVCITKLWSGAEADFNRYATARLLWSEQYFFARFDCAQGEPYVVNADPQLKEETQRLWEKDVCEIFLAPNGDEPERYFEFEIAPTGEWLDAAIWQLPDRRESDWSFDAGMQTAAEMREDGYTTTFRIEWQRLGQRSPQIGERWKGNLFRCVGSGETRGYLAWQPTLTAKPNFHVPARFGWFEFVD